MSKGDKVPDVITTVWNRSNTGFIAMEESKQLKKLFLKKAITKSV